MPQNLGGSGDVPLANQPPDKEWDKLQLQLDELQAQLPPALCRFPLDTPVSMLVAALRRDGCVIIERAVSEACCDAVLAEMDPYLDAADVGDGFLGRQTRRAGAVVSRSPASWEILCHPTLLKLCEGVVSRQVLSLSSEELTEKLTLGSQQFGFQLSLSQVICIGDGNRNQPLHRDSWGFVLDLEPNRLEAELNTMWALEDFSIENGATRLIPGSHRWNRSQRPGPEDKISQAVMPKGSVVIYLGSTWHGGGKNTSGKARRGLNVDYNLGPLRTEENMYLAAPPSVACDFPVPLQRLVGYEMSGTSFGYFGEYYHPREALDRDTRPINWASPRRLADSSKSTDSKEQPMSRL